MAISTARLINVMRAEIQKHTTEGAVHPPKILTGTTVDVHFIYRGSWFKYADDVFCIEDGIYYSLYSTHGQYATLICC